MKLMKNVFASGALTIVGVVGLYACGLEQVQHQTSEDSVQEGYVLTGSMTPDKALSGSDWNTVNKYMIGRGWEYTEHPN